MGNDLETKTEKDVSGKKDPGIVAEFEIDMIRVPAQYDSSRDSYPEDLQKKSKEEYPSR